LAQIALQEALLSGCDIIQQLQHAFGEGDGLGSEKIEILAGVLAFDRLEHARGQRHELLAIACHLVELGELRGLQRITLTHKLAPCCVVDRQVRLVLVLEHLPLRGDIATKPGDHGVERTLEIAHFGQHGNARRARRRVLLRGHDRFHADHDRDDHRVGFCDQNAQRRLAPKLVGAQIEQPLWKILPVRQRHLELIETALGCLRRAAGNRRSQQFLQLGQVGLEGFARGLIVVLEDSIAESKITAHLAQHAQQVCLCPGRGKRARCTQVAGAINVADGVDAAGVIESDDDQGQRNQNRKADREFAAETQAFQEIETA
jgi:hypothetical protein